MIENAYIRRPRVIAGTVLDAAIARYVEGLGFDVVRNCDDDVFDRLVIVPHAITAADFTVDAVAASHISAAIVCSMPIEIVYLNPAAWPHADRVVSTDVLLPLRIGSDREIKAIEASVHKFGRLCSRSLKRPAVSGQSPLLSLTIEKHRKNTGGRRDYRSNDVRQTHLLDYLTSPVSA